MANRSRGRPDGNQNRILKHIRGRGAFVKVVSQYPKMLDLIVVYNGVMTWWEIKMPGHEGELSEAENAILAACGNAAWVVSSIALADEILDKYCASGGRLVSAAHLTK